MTPEEEKTAKLYKRVFNEPFIKELLTLQDFVEDRDGSYDVIKDAHKQFMDVIVETKMKSDVAFLGLVSVFMRLVQASSDAIEKAKKEVPPIN